MLSDALARLRKPPEASLSVAHKIPRESVTQISVELETIINHVFPAGARLVDKMSGEQFQLALTELEKFAQAHHIQITKGTGMTGVYPKGLRGIELVFGETDAEGPGFALRHELAHMFHTLEVRAALIEAIKSGKVLEEDAAAFLADLEEGGNYLEFEKVVTSASSFANQLTGHESARGYATRLRAILKGTAKGLRLGVIHFPNGKSLEDVYGLFLSKAPLVLGSSGKSMALRMPFIMFGVFYAINPDSRDLGLNPDDWGLKMKPGQTGFRDFLKQLLRSASVPRSPTF